MTEIELNFYERLDNEIYDRCREICEELDLLYRSYLEYELDSGRLIISIIDNEGDCVDNITIPYDKFCDTNYLNEARIIRNEQIRIIELAKKKKEAAEAKKKEGQTKRRKLYEELKKEFEGEL
jgi:hypothetical protein